MTTTNHETIKAAKKAHTCEWCGERINVGESYVRYRWFHDGEAGTNRMHPECDGACNEAARQEGGFIEFTPGEYARGCQCERGRCECRAAAAIGESDAHD